MQLHSKLEITNVLLCTRQEINFVFAIKALKSAVVHLSMFNTNLKCETVEVVRGFARVD